MHSSTISDLELAEEKWREIPGFPRYKVSNLGRIKREAYADTITRSDISEPVVRHYNEIIVKTCMKGGAVEVNLTKNRQQYTRSVALLVAKAFLLGDGNCVFHKDFDNTNNRVHNLSWGKQCVKQRRKKS